MSGASDSTQNVVSAPDFSEPEPYRPLSLLALLGFAAAALYALFIIAGGIVALFQRSPWLLPVWLFLAPLSAIVLSAVARTRIHHSEGTLGGLALTRWGISLSLVFGLLYAAYYAATYMAVRQQAGAAADAFVDHLRKGEVDRAFLLSIPPGERVGSPQDLRNLLEVQYNVPSKGEGGGRYGSFKQAEWVRYLTEEGDRAQIRPLGITTWSHDRGGYRVEFQYHVDTSLCRYDILLTLFGVDVRSGPMKGRQWQVILADTGLAKQSQELTPEGAELMRLGKMAQDFGGGWVRKGETGQWFEMYLSTQPASQRAALRRAYDLNHLLEAAAVVGPVPAAHQDSSVLELRRAFVDFTKGNIVHAGETTFWAPGKQRDELVKRIKDIFDPSKPWLQHFRPQPGRIPGWRHSDGELIFSFPFTIITTKPDSQRPEYVVEAQLAVAVPEDQTGVRAPPWRVVGLEMITGRAAPTDESRRMKGPDLPEPPAPGIQ
jgi:hypothetical protein